MLVRAIAGWHPSALLVLTVAAFGPVVGYLAGLIWRRQLREAAIAVDAHYRWKDRVLTALEFLTKPDATRIHRLTVNDALQHLDRIDARHVVPSDTPRILPGAIATLAAAVLLVIFTSPPQLNASPAEPLAVVVASADRAAEELKSLEEFAREEQDPEIEKLVSDQASD